MIQFLLKNKIKLGLLLVLICLAFPEIRYCNSSLYNEYWNPQKTMCIEIRKIKIIWAMSPGSSADTPCYVVLKNRDGKVIEKKYFPMVQSVHNIYFEGDSVFINETIEWDLRL